MDTVNKPWNFYLWEGRVWVFAGRYENYASGLYAASKFGYTSDSQDTLFKLIPIQAYK